jgi:5-hydroxyisourate hydrolase
MSPITTHVLDTAKGCPAKGVKVVLETKSGEQWTKISEGATNQDGRVVDLIKKEQFVKNTYRLTFETKDYHKGEGFFPYVQIVFEVKSPDQHHHVPLLLSPFGYSTYRGS